YALYPIHKSFGVLILLLVLPRIFVRIKNGWPTPLAGRQAAEIMLSRVVQWVLILSTVLMPVSGMMMSGFGGHGVSVFGLELVAGNYDPVLEKVVPINGDLAGMAHSAHGILGNVLIVALLLHIAGALKSRFIAKDGTVLRMLGKEV
ncbi:MAG: cytochrome b/b6 domain-containing protein, partial [Cellvibrionaceae bacterium]|nr:cytochrome b/b6 domain-containing protein [Cellvibrionaceae bacterium]